VVDEHSRGEEKAGRGVIEAGSWRWRGWCCCWRRRERGRLSSLTERVLEVVIAPWLKRRRHPEEDE
jgi:hypothetical protein